MRTIQPLMLCSLFGLGLSGAAKAKGYWPDDWQVQSGLGIAPSNLLGVGGSWEVGPSWQLSFHTSLAGKRTQALQMPIGFGAQYVLAPQHHIKSALTVFSGNKKQTLAYKARYSSVQNRQGAVTCSGSSCDGYGIQQEARVSYNIVYAHLAWVLLAGRSWNTELGWSQVVSAHVERPNSAPAEWGSLEGVVIDKSFWMGPQIAGKGDAGPYLQMAYRF